MEQSKIGFNYSLHGLRGVATLMVFSAHMIDGFTNHIYGTPTWLSSGLINFGVFGVKIFFFLSGYVIYIATIKSNPSDFFKHRFWRIYPVFFFFTLLFFILNHIVVKAPNSDNPVYLLINLLFLELFADTPPMTPNAWSITFEVWYYILTYALIKPLMMKKGYIFSILALLGWVYFLYYQPITIFYILGVTLSTLNLHNKIPPINNKYYINFIQFFSLATIIYIAFNYDLKYDMLLLLALTDYKFILIFVVLFIFMMTLFQPLNYIQKILNKKILLILGSVSYSFYLTHPYSYLISRLITQKIQKLYHLDIYILGIIFTTLGISCTLLLVYFVHNFIESKIYYRMTKKSIYAFDKKPL